MKARERLGVVSWDSSMLNILHQSLSCSSFFHRRTGNEMKHQMVIAFLLSTVSVCLRPPEFTLHFKIKVVNGNIGKSTELLSGGEFERSDTTFISVCLKTSGEAASYVWPNLRSGSLRSQINSSLYQIRNPESEISWGQMQVDVSFVSHSIEAVGSCFLLAS